MTHAETSLVKLLNPAVSERPTKGDIVLMPSGKRATVLGYINHRLDCVYEEDGSNFRWDERKVSINPQLVTIIEKAQVNK